MQVGAGKLYENILSSLILENILSLRNTDLESMCHTACLRPLFYSGILMHDLERDLF